MNAIKLRPGRLVGLRTTVSGGVNYTRIDRKDSSEENKADDVEADDNVKVERWETIKKTEDPEEHKRATATRSKARGYIAKVCAQSAFGLICPKSKYDELEAAVVQARELCTEFNKTSRVTKVNVYVMYGEIAQTDEEAARGVADELRSLLDDVERGVRGANVEDIREAAAKASKFASMLDGESEKKISAAVEEARRIAREITKKLTKKATDVAEFVQEQKLTALNTARSAFIDTSEMESVSEVPTVSGRVVDIEDGANA